MLGVFCCVIIHSVKIVLMYLKRRILICDMTDLCMTYFDELQGVMWICHMCNTTHSCGWEVTWCIGQKTTTRVDLFTVDWFHYGWLIYIFMYQLIDMRDMTHSDVWHDSFMHDLYKYMIYISNTYIFIYVHTYIYIYIYIHIYTWLLHLWSV